MLRAGAAINDDGAILAYSNAGLVLLRPGKRGTDAPVLGPVAKLAGQPGSGARPGAHARLCRQRSRPDPPRPRCLDRRLPLMRRRP
ncbi:hypothetical protein LP420_10965 [Massilia sp. B-10]|nr:hypothetical protein LP420_10965 [Massilia sp. B-10]